MTQSDARAPDPPPPVRAGGSAVRTLARWTFAIGAAALTFEVAVRPIYAIDLVSDPVFGPIMRPGSTVHFGLEGWGTSHWGPRGVRGDRASLDDVTAPILVVGDSQTEALMVDDDVVFTAGLERRLRRADPTVNVLNVGKASHSVADYVRLAPRYIETFHPRWTVIQVRDSDFASDAFAPNKRHFVRDSDGALTIVDVAEPVRHGIGQALWQMRQRSSFVGYAAVRAGRFREAMAKDAPLFHGGEARPPHPSNESFEVAADYPLDAELAALRDAWTGRLTILYLPELDPHHPDRVSGIGRWLAERCAATGTSFVTLASAFPDFLARGRSPYGFENTKFNEGHMNAEGHAAAGELIANALDVSLRP